ncbi:hypothetical protein ABZ714_26965 [Streptomyces sp. NPDC006798]|uniref:hypothetical protein n=1 Tax=Streptomyces sp. NPDC006798 TaxID=3155462 RepID=UPI0033E89580
MPVAELTDTTAVDLTDLDQLIDQLDERVTTEGTVEANAPMTIGICTLLICTAVVGIC